MANKMSDDGELARNVICSLANTIDSLNNRSDSQAESHYEESKQYLREIRSRLTNDELKREINAVRRTLYNLDFQNLGQRQRFELMYELLKAGSEFGEFIEDAKTRTDAERNYVLTSEEYRLIRREATNVSNFASVIDSNAEYLLDFEIPVEPKRRPVFLSR